MRSASRNRAREGAPPTECPLCRDDVAENVYPRHSLVLQDESTATRNRRVEARLCPSCWEALFSNLLQGR